MLLINIKGGLGNQMFQYAFGRALADERGEELKLDLSGLTRAGRHGDAERPFALQAFNLTCTTATAEEVRAARYPHGIRSRIREGVEMKVLRRLGLTSEDSVARKRYRSYFDGYWQSPRYFEHIRSILLADFTLKQPLGPAAEMVAGQIQRSTAISLHVRRGDYAQNPHVRTQFGLCSPKYYENAIAKMNSSFSAATYFIFSDDIAWVKEHIRTPKHTVFVSRPEITDAEELTLMSMCDHHIIANSSFSWWGAWLNTNPNKIVIAPVPWFNIPNEHSDLIPSSWITLPRNP